MNLLKQKKILHYPSLRTVLLVEQVLKNADVTISREEIKRRLPTQIMHQTLNVILQYFEQRGLILDGHKGVLWIYNPSPKLQTAIKNGREI